jgi:hypothetical protein
MSRINPNNGSVLWQVPGYSSEPALVSQGQVIFWNYVLNRTHTYDVGHTVLCVSASSGESLWSFDVGTPVFQPIVSTGLVMFGAENGYFYVLNQADGTLKWKTYIDLLTLIVSYNQVYQLRKFGQYQSGPYLSASPPLVDSQNQRIFWSIAHTLDNGPYKYSGTIWSIDLSNGSRILTAPVAGNPANIALLNNTLYVSGSNEMLRLDASSGDIQ